MTEQDVTGDSPPNQENLPGEIKVDNLPQPGKLISITQTYLDEHPKILEGAKKAGQDLVAISTSQGKIILIGVGVAAAVVAVTITGAVLYRHQHKKKEE